VARIPNIYHFVFGLKPQTEPFHLVYYLCIESCRQVNRPEAIFFHYQHEPHGPYWEAIKPHLTLRRVDSCALVENFPYTDTQVAHYRYAHASDFIRMGPLLDLGGIYADIDTLFVNPLPASLREKSFVLGREADVYDFITRRTSPSLCNAVMLAEKDAPFGRRWQAEMPKAFDGAWAHHSCLLAHALRDRFPEEVHVEPTRSFYPYMWTRGGLRDLLQRCHRGTEGIYSVHLWNHLWWERGRWDFSFFHGERLTWRFIAEVDTTYTVLARRFLPPAPATPEPEPRPWWRRALGLV